MDFKAVLSPPKELFQMDSWVKKKMVTAFSWLTLFLFLFHSMHLCVYVSVSYLSSSLPPSFLLPFLPSFHLSIHHLILGGFFFLSEKCQALYEGAGHYSLCLLI